MPGILRKLIIFATVDGLILQPLGGWDHHSSLRVDFKDRAIGQHAKVESETWKQRPHLESHGIIGQYLLSVPDC